MCRLPHHGFIETPCINEKGTEMKSIKAMLFALGAVFAAIPLQGEGNLTDDEEKMKIVDFVTLPSRLCGKATMDFRNELRARKLTNREWFDGDTNRLARLICELAQTNDTKISSMMIDELGEYGTSAQLPFLYSCATNPILGNAAIETILRIEGVTSNSVVATESFFAASSHDDSLQTTRLCLDFMKRATGAEVEPTCASNALRVARDFSVSENCHYYCFDRGQIMSDSSYSHSQRRLAYLRQVSLRGDLFEFQANYVTNAINELVAYPEANLPD